MIVTYGDGAACDAPSRHSADWPELLAWLQSRAPSTGPKDGPWLCFADFGTEPRMTVGTRERPARMAVGVRAYSHLVASHAVPIDLDLGQYAWDAASIAARLHGYTYAAWTSYSHSPERPRWRIVVPTAQTMSRAEHYATWETIANLFARDCGEASKDATRLNYLPGACLHPQHAQFITGAGALFPVSVPTGTIDNTDTDGLSDTPISGWNGPTDDETLLMYMRTNRRSPEDAFGTVTRFEALWTADAAALAVTWPPSEPGQEFDHTRADAALANELAYYTGSHGVRMLDLFMRSALAQRERFREDKARRACILACQRAPEQHAFLTRPTPTVGPLADPNVADGSAVSLNVTAPGPQTPDPTGGAGTPPAVSRPDDFFAYLPDHTYIHRPTGLHWPAASLDGTVGKDARMMLDLTHPVHLLGWAPGLGERFTLRELDVSNHRAADSWVYNQYRRPKRPTVSGAQIDPWLKLLHRLYPNDGEHILKYFADAVQNPGRKCNHAIVLGSGTHGIGKDTLLKPLRRGVGEANYAVIQPKALFADFNPWVASVVVQISEMRNVGDGQGDRISKYDMYERCKDLAAAPPATLERNVKHVSQQQVQNVLRLVITTNHGVDGIYIDPEDRRHFCAWSDAPAMQPAEAEELHRWLDAGGTEQVAAFLHDPSLLYDWKHGAPPPKTDWWRRLVLEGNPQDDNPLADAVERMGAPAWVTAEGMAKAGGPEIAAWFADARNRKQTARALAKLGYARLPNPTDKRGRFSIGRERLVVYAKAGVTATDIR